MRLGKEDIPLCGARGGLRRNSRMSPFPPQEVLIFRIQRHKQAEPGAAADRGRMFAYRGSPSLGGLAC